jgi:Mannosyl oligosaccharide glucosidase.
LTEEDKRLREAEGDPDGWRLWGPYLADRAWGTVREDYSADGDAWNYFPHDHARSRAYRWNEDGLGGLCDIRQFLCFGLALWNGRDPFLKERLFGLTGPQGNHGEDVKEYYYYLDATPTHSYLKFLYKYPQAPFPYEQLVAENARRGRTDWEFELSDTGVFAEDRYFDVFVEYAKEGPFDIAIRVTAWNRGPEATALHLLPTLWFRNTWSWDRDAPRPTLYAAGQDVIAAEHARLGTYRLYCDGPEPTRLLFTENETNERRLFGAPNPTPYVKDGIHEAVVGGNADAVNPEQVGTRAAFARQYRIGAGESVTMRLRLRRADPGAGTPDAPFGPEFDALFDARRAEADAFYDRLAPPNATADARAVQRQAYAGLIWSRQYYHYDVERWQAGDPGQPTPPDARRRNGRNHEWKHVIITDVLSMPDKWEYPWFAAWDLAFHMIPFAQIDADFAKHQMLLLCREWFMHPNGQLPAYEWQFSDVNPPVHAWAALRLYKIERKMQGKGRNEPGDTDFLERIFHKLLLNFTWWVNQKDQQNNNIFEGGFLGLDNISLFDRSAPLPGGGMLEQSDGTAWMAMYCLNLLAIALELARVDPTYQDVATKFAEHFVYIAHAMNEHGDDGYSLWDEEDGFYYDLLHLPPAAPGAGERYLPLKIRSVAGLIPLFAAEAFDADVMSACPDFLRRLDWFLAHKPHLAGDVAHVTQTRGKKGRILFSLVNRERLRRILARVLDETEFLSPYGVRSLSRFHAKRPFTLQHNGTEFRGDYEPAESTTALYGGNSNWRGPVWFPLNYLLIESLQKYDYMFGDSFTVEMPTGSGNYCTLWEVATELSHRLIRLFLPDESENRPCNGGPSRFQTDPHWRDHLLFHEYFHGDNGAGLGASHQTGWTALVAKLISQSGD